MKSKQQYPASKESGDTTTGDKRVQTTENTPNSLSRGKLYVLVAGSQGGVGKTTNMVDLACWYSRQGVPTTKIDLDEAEKKIGSFSGYFHDVIHVPLTDARGYNALLQAVDYDPGIILVDSPASTTKAMTDWFDQYYEVLHEHGHRFLVTGVVSSEPSSASGFFAFGAALQDRVRYLVLRNETVFNAPSAWDGHPKAASFIEAFSPAILQMPFRERGLQDYLRLHNLTLSAVAKGTTPTAVEGMYRLMAQSIEKRVVAQFDSAREVLLGHW